MPASYWQPKVDLFRYFLGADSFWAHLVNLRALSLPRFSDSQTHDAVTHLS